MDGLEAFVPLNVTLITFNGKYCLAQVQVWAFFRMKASMAINWTVGHITFLLIMCGLT